MHLETFARHEVITLYGIRNCDTVRKARRWLEDHGIEYRVHDYRESGIERGRLDRWRQQAGCGRLLNRRSATWRGLDADERAQAEDDEGCLQLLLAHPTLIRRPVVEYSGGLLVGFDPDRWTEALA